MKEKKKKYGGQQQQDQMFNDEHIDTQQNQTIKEQITVTQNQVMKSLQHKRGLPNHQNDVEKVQGQKNPTTQWLTEDMISNIDNSRISEAPSISELSSFNNQLRHLQNGTANLTTNPQGNKIEEYPGKAINFITTIIFLGVFAVMFYMLKRHLAKFISFYILKKDYRRLHCMEMEEDVLNLDVEVGLNESPSLHQNANYEMNIPSTPTGKERVHNISREDVQAPVNSRFPTPISISRNMTREEIIQEYKQTIVTNLRLYHPLIASLSNNQLARAFKSPILTLPRRVSQSLSLSWLLITLTLTFALQDLGQSFSHSSLCKDSRSNLRLYVCQYFSSSSYYNSNGGTAFLIALLTALASVTLVLSLARNYFEFLETNKTPKTELEIFQQETQQLAMEKLKAEMEQEEEGVNYKNESSSPQPSNNNMKDSRQSSLPQRGDVTFVGEASVINNGRATTQHHRRQRSDDSAGGLEKMKSKKSLNIFETPGGSQDDQTPDPQNNIRQKTGGQDKLYPIKEDDEEQPFSPSPHDSQQVIEDEDDDIGSDEMSPGKPNNARHGVMNAGPLGLLKVSPEDGSKKRPNVLIRNQSKRISPTNNKSASFYKDDKQDECERCKLKQERQHGSKCMHKKNSNGSFLGQSSSRGSFNSIKDAYMTNTDVNMPSDFNSKINLFPAPIQQKQMKGNMLERYEVVETQMGGATEMELIKYLQDKNNKTPEKFQSHHSDNSPIRADHLTTNLGADHNHSHVTQSPGIKRQILLSRIKICFIFIFYVTLCLSPLYILNQLSTLSQAALSASLLTYLYSLLFDSLLVRPLIILCASFYETKRQLSKCYYLIDASDEKKLRELKSEELTIIGEFYQGYEEPILTTIDSDSYYENQGMLNTARDTMGNNLKSEEDAILGSHRGFQNQDPLAGSKSKMLISVTAHQQDQMTVIRKIIRRKLPTKCSRVLLHETAQIETIVLHTSKIDENEDGILPEIVECAENQEGPLPTENGIFSSTTRLLNNPASSTPVEGDLEAGKYSPDKKLISKPFINTEGEGQSPIKMLRVPPNLNNPFQDRSADISEIDADPKHRSSKKFIQVTKLAGIDEINVQDQQHQHNHELQVKTQKNELDRHFETPDQSPRDNKQNSKLSSPQKFQSSPFTQQQPASQSPVHSVTPHSPQNGLNDAEHELQQPGQKGKSKKQQLKDKENNSKKKSPTNKQKSGKKGPKSGKKKKDQGLERFMQETSLEATLEQINNYETEMKQRPSLEPQIDSNIHPSATFDEEDQVELQAPLNPKEHLTGSNRAKQSQREKTNAKKQLGKATLNTGKQFSPQYSSAGKNTTRRQNSQERPAEIEGMRNFMPAALGFKQPKEPIIALHIKDGSLDEDIEAQLKSTFMNIRNSVKQSIKGDEIRGSFNQLGSKNSLLKSVLLQNRDKEPIDNNCDFSEILKPSPRQLELIEKTRKKSSQSFHNTFHQSPSKEQLVNQALLNSTSSKKKKFSSIIVQPDKHVGSPLNMNQGLKHTESSAFEEIRVNEEDDFIFNAARELNLMERRSEELTISKLEQQLKMSEVYRQQQQNHHISIIENEKDAAQRKQEESLKIQKQQSDTLNVGNQKKSSRRNTLSKRSKAQTPVEDSQPQNLERLNTNSSTSSTPRDLRQEETGAIQLSQFQNQAKGSNRSSRKSNRQQKRSNSKYSQGTPSRGASNISPQMQQQPQRLKSQQKDVYGGGSSGIRGMTLDKGGVSSTLEPISEHQDEVLRSYSKLNFNEMQNKVHMQSRGRGNVNNLGVPRSLKQLSRDFQEDQTKQSRSSSHQNKGAGEFKTKQRELLDKLGKRIATKSKKGLDPEVVEEEIPGHTLENWTQDMYNPDTQSPNPKKYQKDQSQKEERFIRLAGVNYHAQGMDETTPEQFIQKMNRRGTGSVGAMPNRSSKNAMEKQLQLQFQQSQDLKTEEDNHGNLIRGRTIKNSKNSSNSSSSYQLIGSSRLAQQQ